MKALITVLVVLGVTAALCALLMVSSLKTRRAAATQPASQPSGSEVDVLYAGAPMAALTVVEPKSVVLKRIPTDKAPKDYTSDPAAVVGRVLAKPMVEGQAFTQSVLASKNSGINLAAAVPEGMRAVSVDLSNYDALQGLLYPGSVVDVLFSFKNLSHEEEARGQKAVSLTLLKAIQVLAVGSQTIISGEGSQLPAHIASDRKEMVTLLVTPKQAELLQLAQQNGNISLAMRNPLESVSAPPTETQLAQLLAAISGNASAAPSEPTAKPPPSMAASNSKVREKSKADQWEIELIHGMRSETLVVPMPNAENR